MIAFIASKTVYCRPTGIPTSLPTSKPTGNPTSRPTGKPTSAPTPTPSHTPSLAPFASQPSKGAPPPTRPPFNASNIPPYSTGTSFQSDSSPATVSGGGVAGLVIGLLFLFGIWVYFTYRPEKKGALLAGDENEL
jgi:hypothetical protein